MIKNHIFQKVNLFILTVGLIIFTSCSKGGDDEPQPKPTPKPLLDAVVNIKDLYVGGNHDAYFSLEQAKEVTKDSKDWDFKISDVSGKSTGLYFEGNNGATAQLVTLPKDITFETYATAPDTGYTATALGMGMAGTKAGFFCYYTLFDEPQHAVLMNSDKLIIVKTGKGKYVKIKMISYYKGNPDTTTKEFSSLATRPSSPYYTFNYIIQPNGTNNFYK